MKRNSNLNAPILLVIKVAENKTCDVLCFIQNLLVSGWLLDPDQRYDKEESMFHLHSLVSTMSSLSGHNHLAVLFNFVTAFVLVASKQLPSKICLAPKVRLHSSVGSSSFALTKG